MRKFWCHPAALVLIAPLAACGSSHHARPYVGRIYSVAQVQRAFASLGLELHRGASRVPGVVVLNNNRHLGPDHLASSPHLITVMVITRRNAAESSPLAGEPRHALVMRYANVTAVSKRYIVDDVRGAVSALRWGTVSTAKPGKRLIVLADSIGGIRLGESRKSVEKRFGPGRSRQRGLVSYFGGHLLVDYRFHDGFYSRVMSLSTRWGGYHVPRSGAHVGSSRRDLRRLYVSCYYKTSCTLQAGPWPDPVGTGFTVRHGKVVEISVGPLA